MKGYKRYLAAEVILLETTCEWKERIHQAEDIDLKYNNDFIAVVQAFAIIAYASSK